MKAEISENEIRIIPENTNEEYALRHWNTHHNSCPKISFILEVNTQIEAEFHASRYRFEGDEQ